MKKTLITSVALAGFLSTIGSTFAMDWRSVAPAGKEYCASNIAFQVSEPSSAHLQAATTAKVKFCSVVAYRK